MRAAVFHSFGSPDVLRIEDRPEPVPGEKEILVRVRAAPVGSVDLMIRNFRAVPPRRFAMPALFWFFAKASFGFRKPRVKILGSQFAGVVESTGPGAARFRPGDRVFGYLGRRMGAHAENVAMAESGTVAAMPGNLSFEEAAAVPYGAIMAAGILERAGARRGWTILVNGASGGIGSALVPLAKSLGVAVTGVSGASRLDYVRALGADRAIDYGREDFTREDGAYDLIVDVLGRSSFARCRRVLKPEGIYLPVSFKMNHLVQAARTSVSGGKRVVCALLPEKREALDRARELIETGGWKPVTDRVFPLERAAEAHRYLEGGGRTGPVILTMEDGQERRER